MNTKSSNPEQLPFSPCEPSSQSLPLNEGSISVEQTLALLRSVQSIAISGHVNPDGDAIGSALALRDMLQALGKDVVVLLGQDRAAPELYDFLPNYEFIPASSYADTPDLFVVVDASTAKRLGTSERVLTQAKDTLVIDHHTNYEGFAHHYIGCSSAPATATLVWRLIKASGIKPSLNMATYCYVAIMTDTGRFAFRNTNCSAFVDATEMVGLGVDPACLSQLVYESKTMSAMRIEALLIDRMQFSCSGALVYSYIRENDLQDLGLERDATEQLPTILRSIQGVEIAALFREEAGEGVRVNLRSRSNFDVGAFALTLGGGGHAGAAGVSLEMPLEDAIEFVVSSLVKLLPACK